MSRETSLEDPNEYMRMLDLMASAHHRVNRNVEVWAEETLREGARPLGWPRPSGRDGWIGAQDVAFTIFVAMSIEDWPKEDPRGTPPFDQQDPRFQTVLRVAQRALDEFIKTAIGELGGIGRLPGKRAAMNEIKAILVEQALRSGMPRGEAYAAVGLTKQSVSRAQKRERERLR